MDLRAIWQLGSGRGPPASRRGLPRASVDVTAARVDIDVTAARAGADRSQKHRSPLK